MRILSEDQVRDKAREILNFYDDDKALSDTGQLTSFNVLGQNFRSNPWKGDSHKPDGWYLPKDKSMPCLLLEAKASDKDLTITAEDEIKRNMKIALKRYSNVMGITYNGKDVRVYRNEESGSDDFVEAQLADRLQNKDYYLHVFLDKPVDTQEIYKLTRRINDDLHFKFGIRNLYDRMIFTAGALVAVRYGLKLHSDMDYTTLQSSIISTLNKSLEPSKMQNIKVDTIVDVFRDIRSNYDPGAEAIKIFVDNVNAISENVNSSHWRGEDVMAIFFNEFNRYKGKSDNGQVFTPQHIANFMYRLINISPQDSVFDGTCGSGTFLTNSMSNMITAVGGPDTNEAIEIKQHRLYGIEFDKTIYALACANMMIHKDGKTNLELADTMSDDAAHWMHDLNWDEHNNLKKYHITKVLMNPPYERKYKPIKILNNVFNNMPKGTDAAVLLPDHKLEKESKKQVKELLTNNKLTKIIKLPEETFSEGVSVSIFIFKLGEPTDSDAGIFTCEIKEDGLETVKNQGRQDIKHRWPKIEDSWVKIIKRQDTSADKTCQWITPDLDNCENLSYPVPQAPFSISEDDFMRTVMNYEMFKQGIDTKELEDKLIDKIMYQSKVQDNTDSISIELKKAGDQ